MQYDVLLTKLPGNGYVARPFLWPELTISGATEADVLTRIQQAVTEFMANSRVVQINAPVETESVDDPWLRYAGIWADIPVDEWEQYLADVEAARQAMNQ